MQGGRPGEEAPMRMDGRQQRPGRATNLGPKECMCDYVPYVLHHFGEYRNA